MIKGLPRRVKRKRRAVHLHYVEMQREFPDDFPRQQVSPATWNDVPGCQGSGSWRGPEQFHNMINCACPTEEAWNRG